MKNKKVFTCGHSNKPIVVFIDNLKKNKIEVLVDIRTIPVSRFCPHFNQNALQHSLNSENIKYLYRGKNLGGRGINIGYEKAIDEIVEMVENKMLVAVMCSEGDYHNCHRFTDLTPSFEERGLEVVHIEYEKNATKHK